MPIENINNFFSKMKIQKKNDETFKTFFEVIPETYEDCEFIDYIERATPIKIGGHPITDIGNIYKITYFRIS